MGLRRQREAFAFVALAVLARVPLQTSGATFRSAGAGPAIAKELSMQSPPGQDKSIPPIPEMVGATSAPFYIFPGTTEISLPIHPATGPARLPAGAAPNEVALEIEGVMCDERVPTIGVYLNVPSGDAPLNHPELSAGSLGTFGIQGASHPGPQHPGTGLSLRLEVTPLIAFLIASKNWDPTNLRVSFVPGSWDAPVPKVKVGRVSLYFS